jgi:diguanylate cyclase (GGDEF)-like protein
MLIFSIATQDLLGTNVRILKSHVTKLAYQGVVVAICSIMFATLLVSFYRHGAVSLDGVIEAHTKNYALWILDAMPFVFALWGQYSSSLIAYEAGAMIFDQTQELRNKAEYLEKQANYTATHDTLTGLPNRALFYDRVEQAILAANAQNTLLSILQIEIENLKEINDTLGRNSSDVIVKQIATRLHSAVSDADSVARIDGNMFSILLTDVKNNGRAAQFAAMIHKALEPLFIVERLKITVQSNIGIVHFPEHGEDVDSLVQRAGVALYIAGKSNEGYAVYNPSYDKHSPRRLTLMSELRHALQMNELELYYQCKTDIASGHPYGAEALVRWRHPKHGFISPDEFIPMAERTRMIQPLTQWVLKRAFLDCVGWQTGGLNLRISVNLSARDLQDPEFPDLVAGIVAATHVQPQWILLEITESSIMTDPERALETMNRINQMGFQFSIDDFGTGYSSLAYLKKLPLAELKIDRSFVKDILNSDSDAAIVNTTINLAHNLGLQVTAEGVETAEIMQALQGYGCDIAQGDYISQPLSGKDFTQWLYNSGWKKNAG